MALLAGQESSFFDFLLYLNASLSQLFEEGLGRELRVFAGDIQATHAYLHTRPIDGQVVWMGYAIRDHIAGGDDSKHLLMVVGGSYTLPSYYISRRNR
jgi:hypothetical protein